MGRARVLVGVLAVVIGAGTVSLVLGNAGASPGTDRLAARLIRLDPGFRLGANTQVATAPGVRLSGVRHRVNFMIGLGHRQRIVGGAGHDQLGFHRAVGAFIHGRQGHDLIHGGPGSQRLHGGHGHDLIYGGHGHDSVKGGHGHDRIHGGHGHDRIHGGHGHDSIYGGHGHDRIHGGHGDDRIHGGKGRDRLKGGKGRNRIIDRRGATVVVAGPGINFIDVADGSSDRLLCAAGSTNRIVVDRGDRLHPDCRSQASNVRYVRPKSAASTANVPAARAASGDGSSGNPYVAECADPQNVVCTVNSFPARSISGLWASEYVPAYQCPPSHPYLYDNSYAPAGTALPHGVDVIGLGPIGVSITGIKTIHVTVDAVTSIYTKGTDTGFPNSSATNWEIGTNSYRVELHCTSSTYYAFFTGYV